MSKCKGKDCDFFDGVSGCDRPEEFKICKESAVNIEVSKDIDSDVDSKEEDE